MSNLSPVDFDPFADGELSSAAPATAAQREIWVASQLDADTSLAYNESCTLVCRGAFDRAAMWAALRELPARHEALRGTFSGDGRTLCIAASLEMPILEIDATPPKDGEHLYQEAWRQEASTPFDLGRGPLVRATIVKVAHDEHRIILGAHHIVCDGWSFSVLLRDLAAIYSAKKQGVSPDLPAAHAFSAYAREEESRDQSAEERYWLMRCEPLPEPLDLPIDRPRPAFRSVASDRVDLALAPDLVAAVKKAGAKSGASFFVTLFSAFGVLVGRLSGQHDLVIGIPAAGQSAVGRDTLVGHCANLLPVRMNVAMDAPLSATLKQVRKTVLDAYEHQRFTLGDVLAKLEIPHVPNRLPLVSILFNLDTGMAPGGLAFDGLDVSFRANPRIAETFELFFNVFEGNDTVVECQYSTALFDRATVVAWLGAYESILRAFVAHPELPAGRLPVLSQADARRVVGEWNATSRAYPSTSTMFDLVVEQAARTPDKAAVVDRDQTLTYAELVTRSRSVAAALAKRGVGARDLVAIVVERSALMAPLLLGVQATGAAYIPVDPEYPAERVAAWITKAKVCVVSPRTKALAAGATCDVASMEELLAAPAGDFAATPSSSDARAYVLFTSGSTGTPKGVEVTHKNLVNFVCAMKDAPGMRESDVLAAVVTLSFDISGYEIYVPLSAGATVVVADRETAQDGRDLAELMKKHAVTVLQATPSTFRLLKLAGYDPRGLKALVGGEAFPPDLAEWLLAGGADVTNCYGPTETTIWSTTYRMTKVTNPIPIGKPLANQTAYVLDADGELCAIGAVGELFIGGDGVARGYLDQPSPTAERFVTDRFSDRPGARLYRTGDRARLRHDGVLEYFGRADDQIKVRGHRIEIGEIETGLHGFAPVSQAGVSVVTEDGGDPRLAAFIVPKAGETVTATEVRRHLRKSLPDAMIPQIVRLVTEIPKTANGKIDRRALAKLGAGDTRREREIVAPSTDTERFLVDLFQRALKVDRVSIHDNFFSLGGDSLKSMEVVIEVEKKTGVRIRPRSLLLSSIADTAKSIAGEQQA
ncbi:MAG: hypothetical protein BGO98_24790 [Myxococcales bacterium 68-20]|nr:MAG: hypothetical protein BGO98_24790 [Myxococcales bacterium 68-20]